MNKKSYYFYPPNKSQFYFPIENFNNYSVYYSPYTIKSKLFWFLFKNIGFVRKIFIVNEENIPLEIGKIKRLLKLRNSSLFFNLGSKGPEQKLTVIGDNNKEKLFLKFAETQIAKELVNNEIDILLELQKQKTLVTANLLSYGSTDDYSYLTTDVILGKKYSIAYIDDKIFDYLINLIKVKPVLNSDIKKVFSHGDFCPWNMLIESKTNKLILIDWEMAGYKPLGYDLFTFLFQTNFLLKPKLKCSQIIKENKVYINIYFRKQNISNWEKYLIKFASLKIQAEEHKKDSQLLLKYQQLLNYNESN